MIAVFDIGKTNKKLLVLDEDYQVIDQLQVRIPEIEDEDGDPCEDLSALTNWIKESAQHICLRYQGQIRAIQITAYGASMVHLDSGGQPILPLYNYLKPFPRDMEETFYANYGGQERFCTVTASPRLGSLNSGLQLLRIRKEQPLAFERIRYSLHLPEYLAYTLSGKMNAAITSIGCHTAIWDFNHSTYHQWVTDSSIRDKLATIEPSSNVNLNVIAGQTLKVGIGVHDSSAALVPYMHLLDRPFVLLSTGTWNICLHPFHQSELTIDELRSDVLCYLSTEGKPVKASRLFAGSWLQNAHEKIAGHFQLPVDFYNDSSFVASAIQCLSSMAVQVNNPPQPIYGKAAEPVFDPVEYARPAEAYVAFMIQLVTLQVRAIRLLTWNSPVPTLYIDGGFARNQVFLNLIGQYMPEFQVYVADIPQASALGAAMLIHEQWNQKPLPSLSSMVQKLTPS